LTLGELAAMADGRMRRQWDQTALLAAEVHNLFARRPRTALDYHPYRRSDEPAPEQETPAAVNTGELLMATFCPS